MSDGADTVEEFLSSHDMEKLPCGKYRINADNCVNVFECETKKACDPVLEKHSLFEDWHYIIDGEEKVFLSYEYDVRIKEYDEKEDFALYRSSGATARILKKGDLLFCGTNLLHGAGYYVSGPMKIKKAVFKIRKKDF